MEVPDLYSLVLPSLGRIEVVIITILWLASVGFIVHCLHPSISSQLCFNPTYYLTCGMEDLLLDLWHGGPFPARTFVGQISMFILCLGSELVIEISFGELDCMHKSFWSVVPMFGTVQNSPLVT